MAESCCTLNCQLSASRNSNSIYLGNPFKHASFISSTSVNRPDAWIFKAEKVGSLK